MMAQKKLQKRCKQKKGYIYMICVTRKGICPILIGGWSEAGLLRDLGYIFLTNQIECPPCSWALFQKLDFLKIA